MRILFKVGKIDIQNNRYIQISNMALVSKNINDTKLMEKAVSLIMRSLKTTVENKCVYDIIISSLTSNWEFVNGYYITYFSIWDNTTKFILCTSENPIYKLIK